MKIIKADEARLQEWLAARARLWGGGRETHAAEAREILKSENAAAYLLLDEAQTAAGFIEGAVYARAGRRYGYVEGWYVAPAYRKRGHGARLLDALEQWFLHRSISLVLSDTIPPQYPQSRQAHKRSGFEEWFTIHIFKKRL